MDWESRDLVRSAQLPTRVQISRIFDWPNTILYGCGGRHGDHVRGKPLNMERFVPLVVVLRDWPTDCL